MTGNVPAVAVAAPPAPLGCCAGCGWYTRQYADPQQQLCLRCTVGWLFCAPHARLEWASSVHRKVTAADVLRILGTLPSLSDRVPAGGGRLTLRCLQGCISTAHSLWITRIGTSARVLQCATVPPETNPCKAPHRGTAARNHNIGSGFAPPLPRGGLPRLIGLGRRTRYRAARDLYSMPSRTSGPRVPDEAPERLS